MAGHLITNKYKKEWTPRSQQLETLRLTLGKNCRETPWNKSLPRNSTIVISFGTAYFLELIRVLYSRLRKTA